MNTIDGNAAKHQVELEVAPRIERLPSAPILITENEVVFSTAAAVSTRPTTKDRWLAVIGRRPRQHYPRRYAFLEHSCMARAMDRL